MDEPLGWALEPLDARFDVVRRAEVRALSSLLALVHDLLPVACLQLL